MRIMVKCGICQRQVPKREAFPPVHLRSSLLDFLQTRHPNWDSSQVICLSCLNSVRTDFVEQSLLTQKGTLSESEAEVLEAVRRQESVLPHPDLFDKKLTLGEKVADKIAAIGGSWTFILLFLAGLVAWICINSLLLVEHAFDPHPFILLNLILSCLAALQAPVIMMSQNRQASKDRAHAEADFKTNLKAEIEIRHLHTKIDELVTDQWQKLLEIQQVQMEMLRDATRKSHLSGDSKPS